MNLDKYTPPFLDGDHPAWVAVYNFGHHALCETDFPREKTDEHDRILGQTTVEAIMQCVNEQATGFLITGATHRVGPAFANYHLILARIKKTLDLKNIANPTRLIDIERVEKPEK